MFKYTKLFIALPYAFLLWFGKPWRRYRDDREYYFAPLSKAEHYTGRFFAFLLVLFLFAVFCTVLVNAPGVMITIAMILVLIAFGFDLAILGCRSLLVFEVAKRTPEGGNPLAVWNDRSLWEDD